MILATEEWKELQNTKGDDWNSNSNAKPRLWMQIVARNNEERKLKLQRYKKFRTKYAGER